MPNLSQPNFHQRVEELVRQVPAGHVTTYGDLAALAGQPTAARIVGGIAHFGDDMLPWHRVVNAKGGLASGYPGDREAHAAHLQAEGITCDDGYVIDFKERRWQPAFR